MPDERFCRRWIFTIFPPLYLHVRAYNVAFYKKQYKGIYERGLSHYIAEIKAGRMFGERNDYSRLLDY